MSIREVQLDGNLANDAEAVADMLGYDNLDYFINHIVEEKVNEVNEVAAVVHAVNATQSDQQQQ